jgi:hypothetical protein
MPGRTIDGGATLAQGYDQEKQAPLSAAAHDPARRFTRQPPGRSRSIRR